MAKSSGHFAKGNVGYFSHNDRSFSTKTPFFQMKKMRFLVVQMKLLKLTDMNLQKELKIIQKD